MTYRTNETYRIDDDVDCEPDEPPKRRRSFSFIVTLALAIVGIGSAFLWRGYGGSGPAFPSFTSASAPSADAGITGQAVGVMIFKLFSNSWPARCKR